jgi:hypothetical protein
VLYYTDARVQSYLTTNNYITNADVANLETLTSLSLAANTLSYVDEAGNTTNLDLSLYLDDTNLARLVSGTLDGATGIATFTRDDASTFTVDLSSLTPSETDPVFTASAASGITPTNISNWDTAYGWGDHSSVGYLTSFTESDPTVPSHVKSITTTKISNWDTAFGWGNHASAGYLTSLGTALVDADFSSNGLMKRTAAGTYSIVTDNSSNWNTAFGWGNHASAAYLTSLPWNDNDTFTGTYPIVWTSGNELYRTSWLQVRGSDDTFISRRIEANGDVIFTGNLYGPIFYDSNNTSYYVDPASLSVINHLDLIGGGTLRLFRTGGGAHQRADARLDGTNQSRLHWYGKNDSDGTVNFKHAWYDGSDYIDVTASSGGITFDKRTGTASIISDGSFRAPIFYDSNNTGYYANPASTSVFNQLNATTVYIGGGVFLQESSDRADLLQITSATSGWAGIQIRNSSNEGRWSFMTDGAKSGFYDDENNKWAVQMDELGEVRLYFNSSEKLNTHNTGVTVTGAFTATGDITAFSSDERLKENIELIENPIDKLKQLKGVIYSWKEGVEKLGFMPSQKQEIGVIAQDVQKVIPHAVKPAPFDTDRNGNSISGENYLTVQYEKIVPLLIEAVKEQNQIIEDLKQRITKLEA